MYDQVQGDNMKNRLLFMMLTILGAPGIAAAAGYDLANSEYNFTVNELSKSSFNQAAIIGQIITLHILIRRAVPTMPVFRKVLMVILR